MWTFYVKINASRKNLNLKDSRLYNILLRIYTFVFQLQTLCRTALAFVQNSFNVRSTISFSTLAFFSRFAEKRARFDLKGVCNLRTLSQLSAAEWSTWDIHKALLLLSTERTIFLVVLNSFTITDIFTMILESIFLKKKKKINFWNISCPRVRQP